MPRKIIHTIFILAFLSLVIPISAEEVPYGIGSWEAESLGNHRAVIHVLNEADAVWLHISWRRRDYDPAKKNVIIIDSRTGKRIKNVCRVEINREFGDLVFQPTTVPGSYYVYYLPYTISGRRNYPTITYQKPEYTAEKAWLQRNGLIPEGLSKRKRNDFPEAQVLEIQAINEFNSFYPMEVIATSDEVKALVSKQAELSYLLFPEDRKYPICMTDDLPLRWIKTGPQKTFRAEAARGEFYAFQIGVYSFKKAIKDINVCFSSLRCSHAKTEIPASTLRCFNTGGVD